MKNTITNLSNFEFKISNEFKKILIKSIKKYCSASEIEFFLKLLRSETLPNLFKLPFIDLISTLNKKEENKIYVEILKQLDFKYIIDNKKFPYKTDYMKLMKHQKESLTKAYNVINSKFINGYLLCDEPGLGKTKATIEVQKFLDSEFSFKKILIICPLSLIGEWEETIKEEFKDVKISTQEYDSKAEVCITTYESAQKFPTMFNSIILDEAHTLHNIEQQSYEHVFELCKFASLVTVMTATPVRSSFVDLFSLYGLIDRSISTYEMFKKAYELIKDHSEFAFRMIRNNIKQVTLLATKKEVSNDVGEIHIIQLQSSISTDELQNNKLTLSDIHSNIDKVTYRMNKLKKYYKSLNVEMREKIRNAVLSESDELIAELKDSKLIKAAKLMKEYSHPERLKISHKMWNKLLVGTIELQFSDEHIKDITNLFDKHNKIIIVTKSRKSIDIIIKGLKNQKIEGLNVESSDSFKVRSEKIEKFQNSKNERFIISTYDIIESGFNVQKGDAILIIDSPYRPHSFIQILHRTQRLNNISKEVFAYILHVSENDILYHDKTILDLYNVNYQNVMNSLKSEE